MQIQIHSERSVGSRSPRSHGAILIEIHLLDHLPHVLHRKRNGKVRQNICTKKKRRDPERGLQSWFRPAKPETRNPKPTVKVGFKLRNPKPETDSEDLTSPGPIETRNPKPETDSEDLPSPGPIETRNPKPETRNRLWRLNFPRADRNPKTETRNRLLKLVSNCETRNPKPTAKVGFNRRNPKPETRNRQRKLVSSNETRNPKPETDSESWFQSTKPETRNPKPTRIRLLGGSPDRNSRKRKMGLMKNYEELWRTGRDWNQWNQWNQSIFFETPWSPRNSALPSSTRFLKPCQERSSITSAPWS